jgi:Spy/CpxP family protein refolding chaperone
VSIAKLRFRPTGLILSLVLIGAPFIAGGLYPASASQGTGRSTLPAAQVQPQSPPQAPAPIAGRQGAPTPGGSQRPGRQEWEWWKDADVQKALVLTEAKVKNIARIVDERTRRIQPLLEKLQKEFELLDLMAAEQKVSIDEFGLQANVVGALQAELFKSRQVMNYRIRRELTPEQYKKLEEIRDRRNNGGRGRGTGPRH